MRHLIIILAISVTSAVEAQDTLIFKKALFVAKVHTMANTMESGYLWAINDTAAQVRPGKIYPRSELIRAEPYISYADIQTLEIRRKGSALRGMAFGALAGLAVGAIIGVLSYEEPDCDPNVPFCFDFGSGFDATAGAGVGLLVGAAGGAIIGAVAKTTIPIKGHKERMRDAIKRVTILKRR